MPLVIFVNLVLLGVEAAADFPIVNWVLEA